MPRVCVQSACSGTDKSDRPTQLVGGGSKESCKSRAVACFAELPSMAPTPPLFLLPPRRFPSTTNLYHVYSQLLSRSSSCSPLPFRRRPAIASTARIVPERHNQPPRRRTRPKGDTGFWRESVACSPSRAEGNRGASTILGSPAIGWGGPRGEGSFGFGLDARGGLRH